MINIITFIKKNWVSTILVILLVGMTVFHFFETYNPPITQAVIISPLTKNKKLDNGQLAQIKTGTPGTTNPYMSGFSKEYVKDTIGKILGVKEKEILAINQVKGSYVDSLQYVREELDGQKKLVRYYQSKDSKGNIVGNGKITDNGAMVYEGNTSIATILKKGQFNKRGHRITPDSLVFYDPNQKFKVNESWEYSVVIPEKTKKQKLTISVQAGVGFVAPKFDVKQVTPGYYVGTGVSYNF